MLSTIYYNKDVEKHTQNFKYTDVFSIQKKYFLLCEDCFWMASTLPDPFDNCSFTTQNVLFVKTN